jgi:hypothetical protein
VRRVVTLLVLLTLALRGAVPLGFAVVPQVGTDGSISIVICTGSGAAVVSYDAAGNPVQPNPHKSSHESCPFAAAHAAVIAVLPAIPLPGVTAASRIIAVHAETIAQQYERPAPGRGPPLRV